MKQSSNCWRANRLIYVNATSLFVGGPLEQTWHLKSSGHPPRKCVQAYTQNWQTADKKQWHKLYVNELNFIFQNVTELHLQLVFNRQALGHDICALDNAGTHCLFIHLLRVEHSRERSRGFAFCGWHWSLSHGTLSSSFNQVLGPEPVCIAASQKVSNLCETSHKSNYLGHSRAKCFSTINSKWPHIAILAWAALKLNFNYSRRNYEYSISMYKVAKAYRTHWKGSDYFLLRIFQRLIVHFQHWCKCQFTYIGFDSWFRFWPFQLIGCSIFWCSLVVHG